MAARTHIFQGTTARRVLRWFAVDSGGVSRLAKRVFVIDAGGVARLIHVGEITAQVDTSGGYVRSGTGITLSWNTSGAFGSNNTGGGGVSVYNWLLTGASADAEIFFHVNSQVNNPVTGVTFDTWLPLTSTRTIQQAWPGGVGSTSFSVTVQIRDKNTLAVVASGTVTGGTTP